MMTSANHNSGKDVQQGNSLWSDSWHRLKANTMAMIGLGFLIILIIISILTPLIAPYGYETQNLSLSATPPSKQHWLGTDTLGRDLLTRIMYGGRISLLVGFAATAVSLVVGVLWGTTAGYIGGRVDSVMMRIVDILYALPFMIFVILLMVIFGQSFILIFLAIGLIEWLTMARIVRAEVHSLKQQNFVKAATVTGLSTWQIICRHLIPNILGPVIVYVTLTIPGVMLFEAFLSFLGLGIQPPQSSWGVLISTGVETMEEYPWLLIFPGVLLSMTLFALNFLGDGLRDALDPTSAPMSSPRIIQSSGPLIMDKDTLLDVNDLTVSFETNRNSTTAITGLGFKLHKGETLGIVGESGSGKSVTCYSVMGLLANNARIISGEIWLNTQDQGPMNIILANQKQMRSIRGKQIGMIFQDPMTSLNPYQRVGQQIMEPVLLHTEISRSEARQRSIELLDEVGIPNPRMRVDQYPHEFSGGMRQRVMIAMALITQPQILIADEPTSALDSIVQLQILDLIKQLQQNRNIAVIFVSHDLAVIKKVAHRTIVMRKGVAVEQGTTVQVFNQPSHQYSQQLVDSILAEAKPEKYCQVTTQDTNINKPLLDIRNLNLAFSSGKNTVIAVDNLSLKINQGEVLGLVGQSGSGKTSLSHAILRLQRIDSGDIIFDSNPIQSLNKNQLKPIRKNIQLIFQDPYSSLNPRMSAYHIIAEPLIHHQICHTKSEIKARVFQLMEEVGLLTSWANKYPHEFSGGQRQRIAIARAVASEPKLIVADEPVSALDVTVQSQILELLLDLVKYKNLTMMFISHDMSVVRFICDRVVVMHNGKVVESGDTESIFNTPEQPYTRQLISCSNLAEPT